MILRRLAMVKPRINEEIRVRRQDSDVYLRQGTDVILIEVSDVDKLILALKRVKK